MRRRTLILALPLAACAAPALAPGEAVPIAAGVALRVPHPALLGQTITVEQRVLAGFPGGGLGFETLLALSPRGLQMVALDGMGRRAMTIDWRGKEPAIEAAPWLPALFRPENLLADLALIYWPTALLEPALRQAGVRLEEAPGLRRILSGDVEIAQAAYQGPGGQGQRWQGRVLFRNRAFSYSLDISSAVIDS